jgi:hypothetical protein
MLESRASRAMKTQLVDDYLLRLAAPIGIYLVGWFDKRKWDPGDRRRGRTPGCTAAPRRDCRDVATSVHRAGCCVGLPLSLSHPILAKEHVQTVYATQNPCRARCATKFVLCVSRKLRSNGARSSARACSDFRPSNAEWKLLRIDTIGRGQC